MMDRADGRDKNVSHAHHQDVGEAATFVRLYGQVIMVILFDQYAECQIHYFRYLHRWRRSIYNRDENDSVYLLADCKATCYLFLHFIKLNEYMTCPFEDSASKTLCSVSAYSNKYIFLKIKLNTLDKFKNSMKNPKRASLTLQFSEKKCYESFYWFPKVI